MGGAVRPQLGLVGLIGAFSSNAISAGVGALIGGWLCDRYGRKRIYQWDLLLYAFGLLWIIFAAGAVDARLRLRDRGPGRRRRRPRLVDADRRDRAGERGTHSGIAQLLWGSARWSC